MSRKRNGNWDRLNLEHSGLHPLFGPEEGAVKEAIDARDFYLSELPEMPTPAECGRWVDGGGCPFCVTVELQDDSNRVEYPGKGFRIDLGTGAFGCYRCTAHGKDIIDYVCARNEDRFDFAKMQVRDQRKWAALWLAETWEV